MFNRWKKIKPYLLNKIAPTEGGGLPGVPPPVAFFLSIGKAILDFFTSKAVQTGLFVIQGVTAHKAAMKAKERGADILLQKYGTGKGMPVIYGTRRVGSTVVYMETINNKELFVVYALAGHEIDGFDLESIHLDGRTINDSTIYRQGYVVSDGTNRVSSNGSTVTRASGNFYGSTTAEINSILTGANTSTNPRMVFNLHKGTTAQAADPMLVGCIPSWTSSHKLTGITYVAANFEYDTRGMFTGIPNLTLVVRGKKVLDTRTSSTAHSNNPALCLLDYLQNDDYGKGIATAQIDTASFSAAANDCDVSSSTINHTSVSVQAANTASDVVRIAPASEASYNKFKVGNTFTVSNGSTTFINAKKLIDKDTTLIDIDGSSPVAILNLKFEDGAVDTAITTTTACTFVEAEKRFLCDGVIDTDESVLENTKLLVANMRGIFTYSNGKYSIKVEGTESSVVSLDEDDILESGITLALENKEAKFNKVEAEFFNAQKRYVTDTVYYTGESSDNFLSDDGNEVLETRIQLPFVTNQRIAYNHAKALLKRSRAQKTISFVATPKVLKANIGEVISVTSNNLDLSSEQYRITNMVIQPDLNIQVTAIEYQTDIYGFVAPPDENIGIPSDPVDGHRVEAPSSLTFTNKNTTTGESAKLTWTDSSKYPSYEFRVQIIISNKTRFDGIVQSEFFYLDGINIDTGFVAKVSAINALGTESEPTELTFAVTTAPITTVDIGQGSIGGFSFDAAKMYHGTGTFNNTNTAVYFDDTGKFSLKDKLSFNGTTLNISGNLTVENTISANKIVVDGIALDDLIGATDQASSNFLSTFSGAVKIASGGASAGYPAELQIQATEHTNAIGTLQQSQTQLTIRARNNTSNGAIAFQGFNGTTPTTYGGFDASGNLNLNQNLVVSGDLTVSGTTTTIDTTNLDVKDKNITLNFGSGDTSANANGAGITIQDAVNSTTDATILWDSANDKFDFSHRINSPSASIADGIFVGSTSGASGSLGEAGIVINISAKPQILFDGGADSNLDIAVPTGEILQIGHWDTSANSAVLQMSMESDGDFSFEGNNIQGISNVSTSTITATSHITITGDNKQLKFTGTAGPLGLEFGDTEANPNFRVYYRTNPNTLTFENNASSAKHTFDLSGNYTSTGDITSGDDVIVGDLLIMAGGNTKAIAFTGTGSDTNVRHFAYEASGHHHVTNRHTDGDLILMSNNGTGGGETTRMTLQSGSGTQDIDITNANLDLNSNNITGVGTMSSGAITTSNILTVDYTAPIIRLKPDNGAFFQLRANESPARLEVGHSTNKNLHLSNTGNATFNFDLNVVSNFKINGTTVIDSSRNLLNLESISLADNKELKFGSDNDLKIDHTGSHAVITNETGNIDITNNANDGDFFFKSDDGSGGVATYIQLNGGTGSVNLRHYGNVKLATTSTGIDVTGTIVADNSISVENSSGFGSIELGGSSGAFIDFKTPFSDDFDSRILTSGTDLDVTCSTGSINLIADGGLRLATTSTGIDVTGTAVVDGLTSSGAITSNSFVKGVNLLVGITSTVGINGTPADGNSAELGNGYLNLARDGTTDAKQIQFAKNGVVHSHIKTTTANMVLGNGLNSNCLNIGLDGDVGVGTGSPVVGGMEIAKANPVLRIRENDQTNNFADIRFNSSMLRLRSRANTNNGGIRFEGHDGSTITNYGMFTNAGNFQIGTTTVIDSSRNLTNIASYTGSGDIHLTGVGTTLKFDTTGSSASNFIKTINDFETLIGTNRGSAGHLVVGNSSIRMGFGTSYTAGQSDITINNNSTIDIAIPTTFAGTITSGVINSTGKHTFSLASGVNGNIIQLSRSAGAYSYNIGISPSSVFQIVDNDGGTQLLGISPTSGNASFAGDISLVDAKKIKLGTDNDLLLYHDGGSVIEDAGDQGLEIRTNGPDIRMIGGSNELMAKFVKDGAVELYHNNVKRLETTSSGVSMTNGLVVEGSTTFNDDVSFGAGIVSNITVNGTISSGAITSSGNIDTTAGEFKINGVTVVNSSRQLRNITAMRIGSTEIIDSSRNLTNIGTISSSAITSSGLVTSVGGVVNTNTGSNPFFITRLGNTSEALSIATFDRETRFQHTQDESTGDHFMRFDINSSTSGNKYFNFTNGSIYVGSTETITTARNLVNIHDITFDGVVRSTNNANVDGPNFNVSTTNKAENEYAYRVDRSGTVVAGIQIDGDADFKDVAVSGVFKIGSTTVIDSSRNLTNIGTISCGAITSTGTIKTDLIQREGDGLSAFSFLDFDMDTGGSAGTNNVVLGGVNNIDFLIDTNNNGTTGAFVFGKDANTMSSATQLMTLDESGHLDLKTGNYKVNGNTVIDTSRNLHNIGTISSTNLTTNGSAVVVQSKPLTVLNQPLNISSVNNGRLKFFQTTSSTTATKGSIQWFDSGNKACGSIRLVANGSENNSGFMEFYVTSEADEITDPFGINKVMTIADDGVTVHGSLSKTSGSFKIDHPLKPDTHHLVHSFVESPQADNTYTGQVQLKDGYAVIDIDEWFGMTEGTFVALNRDFRVFTTNETDWDSVRGRLVDNKLTIECQNGKSNAVVSWLVVGERQDDAIYKSSLTDDFGKIVVEPEKVG